MGSSCYRAGSLCRLAGSNRTLAGWLCPPAGSLCCPVGSHCAFAEPDCTNARLHCAVIALAEAQCFRVAKPARHVSCQCWVALGPSCAVGTRDRFQEDRWLKLRWLRPNLICKHCAAAKTSKNQGVLAWVLENDGRRVCGPLRHSQMTGLAQNGRDADLHVLVNRRRECRLFAWQRRDHGSLMNRSSAF